MCYSKQLKADKYSIERFYDATMRDIGYAPNFYENAFDFKEDPVLTVEMPKEFQMYRWGLIPWWVKGEQQLLTLRNQTLNCISEEMFDKPSFKDSAKQGKRCLIPATAFYEWHWNKLDKPTNKTPYKVYAKDQEIFSIAGLYSSWKDRTTGHEVLSYTVLTTASNPAMSWLHNSKKRQPVILTKEYQKDWLNPNLTEKDVLELCKSMPEDFLAYHSIGKQISGNKLSTEEKNTPEIEKPVEYSLEEIDYVEKTKEVKAGKPKKSQGDEGQQSLF
jgi:putative SOS response-associated peptidase YedK